MPDLTTLLSKFLTDLYAGVISSPSGPLVMQVGGVTKLSVSATAVTSTVPYLAPDGTEPLPSVAGASDPDTGMWFPAANRIYWSAAGTSRLALFTSSLELKSDQVLAWSSGVIGAAEDVALARLAADVIAPLAGDAYGLAAKAWIRTAPTISSGFGTSPSIVASNGTAAFTINVGTGGVATSGVIGLPAATTGWILNIQNLTAQAANRASVETRQTASSTTTATIQNQNVATGAATAWTAGDVLSVMATAY